MADSERHEREDPVVRGNRLFRERRFDQAIQAFNDSLRRYPGNRNVRYNLSRAQLARGRVLFEQRDYGAAIDAMKASLDAWPNDPDALSSLGTACRKAARYGEARDSLRACVQANAQTARPYELFHYVYCGALVDGVQAIPGLLAAIEPNSATSPVRDFWLGVHAYNTGHPDDGVLLMRASGVDFMKGTGNLRTRAEIDRMLREPRHAARRAAVRWWTEPATIPRPSAVVLGSCDWIYFQRYRAQLIRSLLATGFDGLIHIHIVNPRDNLAEEIERTMALAEGQPIGISSEIVPDPTPSYYAIARFIVLPEIVSRYGAPILASDVDLRFLLDPRQALGFAAAAADIGLLDRPLFLPWMRINASFSFWRPTAAGLELARLLSAYLVELNAENQEWMADQSALGQICGIADDLMPGVTIGNLEAMQPFEQMFATAKIGPDVDSAQ